MDQIVTKESILGKLRKHLPSLKMRYPIKSLALFGSYARGEAQKNSDIDLMVDFNGPVGMEVVDFVLDLEKILGQSVDLVTYNGIKNRFFNLIQEDLQYVQTES